MAKLSDQVWQALKEHEVGHHENGGLVDHPDDPGGITKWGISLGWASGALGFTRDDIIALTEEQAREIYYEHWWCRSKTNPISYPDFHSECVASKVFDISVNTGARRAVKILQQALCKLDLPCVVDGIFGPKTLARANVCIEAELLRGLCEEQAAWYQRLGRQRRFKPFLRGWLRRAAWVPPKTAGA